MLKERLYLKIFGLLQVPMIHYVGASLVSQDGDHLVVKIPLRRRTRNHLRSMYFGALCVGADLAAGMIAAMAIKESGRRVSFVFKDMQATFLKRAEGDVYFHCDIGSEIRATVAKALASGERVNIAVPVIARVPDKLGEEAVANFTLTLSLKAKA